MKEPPLVGGDSGWESKDGNGNDEPIFPLLGSSLSRAPSLT